MKRILVSLVIVFATLFPSDTLAQEVKPEDNYKIFQLPKPDLRVAFRGEKYALYSLDSFKLLLEMDADFRKSSEDLRMAQARIEYYGTMLVSTEVQVVNSKRQLKLCLADRSRITEKWKEAEAAKNKAEASKRGGLFAITGWTIAGVSAATAFGLLIGIIAQ